MAHAGLLQSWGNLEHYLKREGIALVTLDVRGCLLSPPRGGNLARVLSLWGADGEWVSEADSVIPRRVVAKYTTREDVSDWTLVTLCELADYAQEHGCGLDATAIDKGLRAIESEYWREGTPLVSDAGLLSLIAVMDSIGVGVVVAADGLTYREERAFEVLFPRSRTRILSFYATDRVGVNKLSPRYYEYICREHRVEPHRVLVVGDRFDKDVSIAVEAGCKTLWISDSEPRGVLQAQRISDCVPTKEDAAIRNGMILGRFQPFHLEHLRFARAAARRVGHLWVGITNPLPSIGVPEANGDRGKPEANPLPYWLRLRCVETALVADGLPRSRFSVIPIHLSAEGLKSAPLGATMFTTNVEAWSQRKEELIRRSGLKVSRLELGSKTIAASDIRRLIREGDANWVAALPEAVTREWGDQIVQFCMTDQV